MRLLFVCLLLIFCAAYSSATEPKLQTGLNAELWQPILAASHRQAAPPKIPPPQMQPPAVAAPAKPKQPLAKKIPVIGTPKAIAYEWTPRNDRVWIANHAVSPTAKIDGDFATIYNVRFTEYEADQSYTTHYYNAKYNINDLRTFDVFEVPFPGMPTMAHVCASFGFADGRYLGLSVEARYELGESYDPLAGFVGQFELIYILSDERDMIRLNTEYKKCDVHLYRLKLTPAEIRSIFVDVLNRANKLAQKPEFYKTVRNNCTTNVIDHINKARPGAIPYEYRVLFPGLIGSFLYDVNLIDKSSETFAETKQASKINSLAERYGNTEYFSAGIRQRLY